MRELSFEEQEVVAGGALGDSGPFPVTVRIYRNMGIARFEKIQMDGRGGGFGGAQLLRTQGGDPSPGDGVWGLRVAGDDATGYLGVAETAGFFDLNGNGMVDPNEREVQPGDISAPGADAGTEKFNTPQLQLFYLSTFAYLCC